MDARVDKKVRYYVVKNGRAFWQPTKAALDGLEGTGLEPRSLGQAGLDAQSQARELYRRLELARRGGLEQREIEAAPRARTVGEAWSRYRASSLWTSERTERTREEWDRVWRHMAPWFAHVDPRSLTMFDIATWRDLIARNVSPREAHRCVKVWRAFWNVMAGMGYCEGKTDPSLGFINRSPEHRQATWAEWEMARIAKRAWREGYYGLAAALAVMWDGLMSPVDVRTLTMADRIKGTGRGQWIWNIDRSKTGVKALAPLSRRGQKVLRAYLAMLGELGDDQPIFRSRVYFPPDADGDEIPFYYVRQWNEQVFAYWQPSKKVAALAQASDLGYRALGPAGPEAEATARGLFQKLDAVRRRHALATGPAYTKDSLSTDFRAIRELEFPGDPRLMMDIRRSGTSEAFAGDANAKGMSDVLGNSIDKNKALQKVYAPAQVATVIPIMEARRLGRQRQREAEKENE